MRFERGGVPRCNLHVWMDKAELGGRRKAPVDLRVMRQRLHDGLADSVDDHVIRPAAQS